MPFPTATKNAWVAGKNVTHWSLHTDFPGVAGLHEVTGGAPAYARKPDTLDAPSGGARTLTSPVTFDLPPCTVKWIGAWDNADFVMCAPNGGATPKNFMATPATGWIHATSHGYSSAQKVVFFGVPPTPLIEGRTYFVRDAANDQFKVAETSGGVELAIAGVASFGCVVYAIVEQVYPTQDTHTLTSASVVVAD